MEINGIDDFLSYKDKLLDDLSKYEEKVIVDKDKDAHNILRLLLEDYDELYKFISNYSTIDISEAAELLGGPNYTKVYIDGKLLLCTYDDCFNLINNLDDPNKSISECIGMLRKPHYLLDNKVNLLNESLDPISRDENVKKKIYSIIDSNLSKRKNKIL